MNVEKDECGENKKSGEKDECGVLQLCWEMLWGFFSAGKKGLYVFGEGEGGWGVWIGLGFNESCSEVLKTPLVFVFVPSLYYAHAHHHQATHSS